jgi:hypothetical protein
MSPAGKKKTTMAKLTRESRLRERRVEKEARKRARKDAAAHPPTLPHEPADFPELAGVSWPAGDSTPEPAAPSHTED